MSDREPPPGHISAQEAAEKLGRTDENIRQRIKNGTLDGTHDFDQRGNRRWWAREGAVVEEQRKASALARVKDVRTEVAQSRNEVLEGLAVAFMAEMAKQSAEFRPLIQEIISSITSQREEVTGELREQRRVLTEMAKTQERMEQRQVEIMRAIEFFKGQSEKESVYQERNIEIQERALELQESTQSQGRGFWSRLFSTQ